MEISTSGNSVHTSENVLTGDVEPSKRPSEESNLTEQTSQKPYTIIRPTSGWQAINIREIWQFRDLLLTLAARDVKLRYRQTALGAIWVILQPLIAAGVFSFVFGKVAKLPSDGIPYFLFSYAGLMGWNAFSGTLGKASTSLVGNAHLISKVAFPRLILPLSTLFSSLIDFGVAFLMMLVLLVIYGVTPGVGILLLPVWLLLLLMLAIGIGLVTSALMVSYRDVGHILPVFIQLLLYASPVAYAVSAVPPHLRAVYFLNPVSGLLEAFRWSLLNTGQLQVGYVTYSAACVAVLFVTGALMFKRMERRFADVI